MKSKTASILLGLCVVFGAQGAPTNEPGTSFAGDKSKEVSYDGKKYSRVSTAEDFVLAISSGKNILVANNTLIDLTPLLLDEDWWHNHGTTFKWLPQYESENLTGRNIVSEEVFDGRQLCIVGYKDILIAGQGNSQIVVDPRYAFCLNFVNCENIKISNLTIGHWQGGYCEGGVIGVIGGADISVLNCNLYGCGTYGLELRNTRNFYMGDSSIHDCTYGIMTFNGVESAQFDRCNFYRNEEFSLIEGRNSSLSFDECRFYANNPLSMLFNLDEQFGLSDCYILHPLSNLGTIDLAVGNNNWFCDDPFNPQFNEGAIGEEPIKVFFKGDTPKVTDFLQATILDGNDEESDCDNWINTWKKYRFYDEKDESYTFVDDEDRNSFHLEWKSDDGNELNFHDFTFWERYDNHHKLFAHSSGVIIDGKGVETECTGIQFYDYDPETETMRLLGDEDEVLGGRPQGSLNIVYRLSNDGKDIVYIDNEGNSGVYLWNGDIFMNGEAFGY